MHPRIISILSMLALIAFGWLAGYQFTFLISFYVIFCRIIGLRSLKALLIPSIYFFVTNDVFSDNMQTRTPYIYSVVPKFYGFEYQPDLLMKLLAVGCFFLLGFGILKLLEAFVKRASIRIALMYTLFFGLVSLVIVLCGRNSPFAILAITIILLIARSMSYLTTFIFDARPLKLGIFAREVFPPFWDPTYSARPELPIQSFPEQRPALDQIALKNCINGIAMVVIGKLIYSTAFGYTFLGWNLVSIPELYRMSLPSDFYQRYLKCTRAPR